MEGGLPRKRFRMVVNDGDFPGSRYHATIQQKWLFPWIMINPYGPKK